jgi:chromosome segregation ATPase
MSEIQEIRHDKVRLESELTESQSELSKACTQQLHLKEKGSKIIDDLKDDLEIMKATEKVLKEDNDKLLHEITNLQQSYQKLVESEKKKCENLSNEVEILQKQMSESITPDVLKVKLGEIDEIFQNKIKEKQRVIDQLSSTLTKINGDMNQVEEQNTKSENDKQEMEQKLRTTGKSMKDLQDKVEHLQKDNEVLENKLKDTESTKPTVSMDEV